MTDEERLALEAKMEASIEAHAVYRLARTEQREAEEKRAALGDVWRELDHELHEYFQSLYGVTWDMV